jgi:hypothetical protein
MLRTELPTLDALIGGHAGVLGRDFTAYRNHAYRVANLCLGQAPGDPDAVAKVEIAAAFHDLGIWTHGTFDYLQPSIELARAHLVRSGRSEWTSEVSAMLLEHHKLTRYRGESAGLVEPFRRADWADVTRGIVAPGLSRGLLSAVFAAWPSAGFHRRLVGLELDRLRSHPLSPLPMLRL